MMVKEKDILEQFVFGLREYERESHNMIGFDEREDEEFVENFLNKKQGVN